MAHTNDLLREEQAYQAAVNKIEARERQKAEQEKWRKIYGTQEIDEPTMERIKNVRAKLYFAYHPVNHQEFKQVSSAAGVTTQKFTQTQSAKQTAEQQPMDDLHCLMHMHNI